MSDPYPYSAGYNAYRAGEARSSNPFPKDSPDWMEWDRGYRWAREIGRVAR